MGFFHIKNDYARAARVALEEERAALKKPRVRMKKRTRVRIKRTRVIRRKRHLSLVWVHPRLK